MLQIGRARGLAQPDLGLGRVTCDELDFASTGLKTRESTGRFEGGPEDFCAVVRRRDLASATEGGIPEGEQPHGTG